MAHYAILDENNIVIQVITGVDEDLTQVDLDGTVVGGSSEAWEEFYGSRPWLNAASCKRTSYNNNIRKRYAVIGYTYNSELDAFIKPQPFPSWILNSETCDWEAPLSYPTDGQIYTWNETDLAWDLIETP